MSLEKQTGRRMRPFATTVMSRVLSLAAFSLFGYCLLADDDPRPVGPPCVEVVKIPGSDQPKCISPYAFASDECTQLGCVGGGATCMTSGRWWDNVTYPLYLTLATTTYGETFIDDTGKVCQHKVQCVTGANDAMKSCDPGSVDSDYEYPDDMVFSGPGECYDPAPNFAPTGCKLCSTGAVLPGGDWTATRKKKITCPFKPPPPEDP